MNDYENDLPNHAEYTVKKRAEGKNLRLRMLLVCGYVLFGLAYFTAAVITRLVPVVAILPIFIWMLVYFTWRYVTPEYSVQSGKGILTVTEILTKKQKPERLRVTLKEAVDFAPVTKGTLMTDKSKGLVIYDYRGTVKSSAAYALYFKDGKERRAVLYFETTPKLVQSVSRYMK